MKKVLYLRNYPDEVDLNMYNLQEIGLCKALVNKGIDCDIVYYSKTRKTEIEIIYKHNSAKLRTIKVPSIKLFNSSIFLKILSGKFLNKYNLIITTEYTQIMSYFLALICKKVVLLHGPYKDNRNKVLQIIYDKLLVKSMNKRLQRVYVKSNNAKDYLEKKGFSNIVTLGVGLDKENFQSLEQNKDRLGNLDDLISKNKVILYVGKLEERRNIRFLFEIFARIKKQEKDCILILVGDGNKQEVLLYMEYGENLGIIDSIVHIKKLEQKYLGYLYKNSKLFLFPTKYEIFGMVLLESMYFGVPVISSVNGGSSLLIEDDVNGYKIKDFDLDAWSERSLKLLNDEELRRKLAYNATNTISQKFSWEKISEKLIGRIE
ncbi:glycosyltransferase family 4 protein [Fictibacillus sp. 5RED26]|uniref:glycosyltransferase family 4 protein n=1 Tax=Fictibacillus sp. 5RED26 TaxID=2745876 RepID=UPI0018CCD2A1|nr:glycosyltransferase family 4 protein [Fictibacillus sp. 5RED26]MBH0156614.1 glycosyltransferase family 4 protein [Fictibacillus sp. 5RED26]